MNGLDLMKGRRLGPYSPNEWNVCLQVNDMDMRGVTREEAVLFLLSLQDQIDLIVQHRNDEYEQVVQSQKGDNFHVK